MAERNAAIEPEHRMQFRIGVNIGDVISDEDRIYGDGVNIAARLEGIAEPGGICISEDAYRQVRGKVDVNIRDAGEHELKNIVRAVRVYHLQIGRDATEAPVLALPDKPSIAVLPFQNRSGDPEQEYFADGMSEDIITALSRFRWFFVIARNSSFAYKGRSIDVRQIGRELGVRYVLEGSVRKGGNRLRITVQLVEAESGNHLWAEKYDAALADVFDLQDKITEGVVGAVEPSVQKAEIERTRRKRPGSLAAYDYYLQALPHAWVNTTAEAENALQLLGKALEIDPDYTAAHGLAALCHWHRYQRGGLEPGERRKAVGHARAVLSSTTDDANALAFAAFISASLDNEHEVALGAAEKAILLSPNSARAHTNRAATHMVIGNYDSAIESALYAIRLNPLDPMRYGPEGVLAISYFNLGRYDAATDAARRAIQSNPGFIHGYAVLAAGCLRLGRREQAQDTIRHALNVEPKFRASAYKSAPVGPPDRMESFMEALRECGLPE
jgi:TolB-like protein/Tfp pilus assembly protein PilF